MGKKNCQNEKKRKQVNADKKTRQTDTGKLKVLFTNCDTLTNKLPELQAYIDNYQPMIIGLNEVKPKHFKRDLTVEEFRLNGYEIMPHPNIEVKDSGRGTILHVHNSLPAKQINIDINGEAFQEVVFSEVSLGAEDKLLVGCFYRSGSNTSRNTDLLMELLRKISQMKYSHILLMGDFNFPEIDWTSWTSGKDENVDTRGYKFLECVRDCYLYQHITEPTRGRGSDTPSTIDLIFTNEEGMINTIDICAPIGKSDHSVLQFEFTYHMERTNKKKSIPQYNKGNYAQMNQMIKEINWDMLLNQNNDDVDKQWDTFTEAFNNIQSQCIPVRTVSANMQNQRKKHFTGIDQKVLQKINHKKSLWKLIRTSKASGQQESEYKRVRNQVRRLTRKSKKMKEKNIAAESKKNPKMFWSYAQSKMKTKPGIPDLEYEGKVATTDLEKAEVLAEFYSSVFTQEPNTQLPLFPLKEINHVFMLHPITKAEVTEKLTKLKINKSPGPDCMHPRVLQETAEELSVPLAIIFNNSMHLGKFHPNGKKL